MYTQVSINKPFGGAGAAMPKDPTIIIVKASDIESEPTREVGSPNLVGNLTLKNGAKAVGVYATPTTISVTEPVSGDPDGRGITQGIEYEHPGNSAAIRGHKEAYLNEGVVILQKDCDGSGSGSYNYIGSKCNPLFLTSELTDNNTARKNKFTWAQGQPSPFCVGIYSGQIPVLADESDPNNDTV